MTLIALDIGKTDYGRNAGIALYLLGFFIYAGWDCVFKDGRWRPFIVIGFNIFGCYRSRGWYHGPKAPT